jgi:hypothetical protein
MLPSGSAEARAVKFISGPSTRRVEKAAMGAWLAKTEAELLVPVNANDGAATADPEANITLIARENAPVKIPILPAARHLGAGVPSRVKTAAKLRRVDMWSSPNFSLETVAMSISSRPDAALKRR